MIERHDPGSYSVVHGPPDLDRWLDRIAGVPGVLTYVGGSAPTVGYIGTWSTTTPAGALGGATT